MRTLNIGRICPFHNINMSGANSASISSPSVTYTPGAIVNVQSSSSTLATQFNFRRHPVEWYVLESEGGDINMRLKDGDLTV